jgi:hypothetical protein
MGIEEIHGSENYHLTIYAKVFHTEIRHMFHISCCRTLTIHIAHAQYAHRFSQFSNDHIVYTRHARKELMLI